MNIRGLIGITLVPTLLFCTLGCDSTTKKESEYSSTPDAFIYTDDKGDSYTYSKASGEGKNSGKWYESQASGNYNPYGRSEVDSIVGDDGILIRYDDGCSEITDGMGNVGRDIDGDGELDYYSIDGGQTWASY